MSDMAPGSASTDLERGDLELEEAWRAAAVEGHEATFRLSAGQAVCPVCRNRFLLQQPAVLAATTTRDTATNRDEVVVFSLACPSCGTLGRLAAEPHEIGGEDGEAEGTSGDTTAERTGLDPPDEEFLQPASEGNLADQGSLLDEEGEDVRQYTGEPVETEDGWVLPQQQNVGPGSMAGGGEWPDPDTPSKQPKPWPTTEEEAAERRNEGTV